MCLLLFFVSTVFLLKWPIHLRFLHYLPQPIPLLEVKVWQPVQWRESHTHKHLTNRDAPDLQLGKKSSVFLYFRSSVCLSLSLTVCFSLMLFLFLLLLFFCSCSDFGWWGGFSCLVTIALYVVFCCRYCIRTANN